MVDDLATIQRWLNRSLALPSASQNAIFDEFISLVEARVDAARQAGTLDLGVETLAVESFEVISDTLLRTDATSGATTHLLERSEEHTSELQSLMRNSYAVFCCKKTNKHIARTPLHMSSHNSAD